MEHAPLPNSGVVRFLPAPGGRGTEVHLEITYHPAGLVGAAIARLFGKEPGQQVESDLRRLKQVLEAGESVDSAAGISRRPASRDFGPWNGGLE